MASWIYLPWPICYIPVFHFSIYIVVSTSQFEQHLRLTHHTTTTLTPCFTYSVLSSFSEFEMCDIYWPVYRFHFSLPAVQYPSPLHGHRWITRPGLAQHTEWCCSSENTLLPSYSNGLCAGWPLACCGTQRKIGRCGRKEEGDVLRCN